MKRLIILAALLLPACAAMDAVSSLPPSPLAAANQTVLDEQIGTGAEVAYKAVRLALELAVDTGQLKDANAAKAADLDNKLYAALGTVRTAYRAGNAPGYFSAAKEVMRLASQLTALIKGAQA